MNIATFIQDLLDRNVYWKAALLGPALAPVDHQWRLDNLGASLFQIAVTEKGLDAGGVAITKTHTIFITVEDFGGVGENVIAEEISERKVINAPTDNSFQEAVESWYETIKPSNIVRFKVLEIDRELKYVILLVFEEVSGTVTAKKKFIRKDGSSTPVVTDYVG